MAKKNSLDLSGLDLSGLDLSGLNDKKEKPSLDLSGLDLSGLDLSGLDNEEEVKKKESTASTSSAGESPSKDDYKDDKYVPPTMEQFIASYNPYGNTYADKEQPFDEGAFLREQEEKQKKANEKFSKVDFNENFKGIDPLDSPEIEPSKSDAFTNIDLKADEDLKRVVEQKERAELEASPEYKKAVSESFNKLKEKELQGLEYNILNIDNLTDYVERFEPNKDPEEYVNELLSNYDYLLSEDEINDFIEKKRKEALKKIGSDQGIKTRSNYATDFRNADPSFTEKDITEMVDSKELSDINIFGVNRLGLDEDEQKEYKKDILRFAELRQKKEKTLEEKLEISDLNKKIAKLREDQDKQFIDPATGKIDGAVKKEVTEKAKLYSKNLKTKSDYLKFLDKYKEEYHNIKGIENYMKSLTGGDEPPSMFYLDTYAYAYANLNKYVSDNVLGEDGTYDSGKRTQVNDLRKKLITLHGSLSKAEKNFMALNRALLLNEDPAAVSRGFKMLEGIPFLEGAGEIAVAGGEALAETVTGDEILTDTDYANSIVELANETGVKLTEEQYERGKLNFREKLGGAIGTSLPMMAEIAFNVLVTKNVAAGLKIPEYISKIKYLQKSPKLAKFIGGAMEATTQAIAFEFAEGGSLAMGAGEYYGGKLGEKLVSAITKGKGGKFLSLFGKIVGAGTAGTLEEYAGEFVNEGFKQGFFTKEQFENTFGRTYDEALDKFLITAVMATAMGGAAEVGSVLADAKSYYKNLGDTQRLTELEQLIEANKKASESTAESKNLQLKLNKEKPVGEEELVPFTKEVDIDGETFLTSEGETKTEEAIEEKITEPTQEQIQEDIANNDFATFKYEDESSVPKELKEYISSKGSTQVGRGSSKKKSVNVTVPKSLANYLNSKAEASTQQSSETTTDTTTEKKGIEDNKVVAKEEEFTITNEDGSKSVITVQTMIDGSLNVVETINYDENGNKIEEYIDIKLGDNDIIKRDGLTAEQSIRNVLLREDFGDTLEKTGGRSASEVMREKKISRLTEEQKTKAGISTTTDTTTEPKTELEVKKESITSELNELQELKKELESKESSEKVLSEGLEEIEGKRLSEEVKEKQIAEEREAQVKELEAKVKKNREKRLKDSESQSKSLEESEATAKIEAEKELAEGLEKIEEDKISKERKESLDQEILQEKRDSQVRELEAKVEKNRLEKVESEKAIGKSLEKSEAIAKVEAEKELAEGLEKIEKERFAEEVQEKQKLEERETQVKELEAKVEKNRLEKVESEIESGKTLEESEETAKVQAEEELAEGLKEIKKKADKEEVETNQEKEKVKKIIKENISTEDKKKIASEEGIDSKDVEAKVIEKVADRNYLAKGKSVLAKVVKAIRGSIKKLILAGGLTYLAFSGVSITPDVVPTYSVENVVDSVFPETPSLPSKPKELGGDPISGLAAGVSLLLRALRRRKRKGKKLDKQDAKDIDAEIARLTKQLEEVDTEIISQKEKQELDKVKQQLEDIKTELESKPASERTLQDKIILDSIKKKGLTSAQAKSLIKNYKTSKKSIKKDIREQTGQTDTSDKITITKNKLAKELYKAEEKALKNLKVSQKKLISNLFKKLSELAGIRKGKEKSTLKGKVSFSNVKKILQELIKLDPSNDNDVLALEHKIDQLVKDSEFEVKKQEAIKLQKQLQKIGKKRKGVRGKYAAELNDIDLNKVESIDAFLETAKSLLGSFKGAIKKDNEITITETDPSIVTQLEKTIKTLKEEQAKYEELLEERREIKRLENLEEEYELSGLSEVMTFEEYEQFKKSSPEEAAKVIPEKSKKELALRQAVSERIDNLKGWLKDNEKTLTQGQKRKINDIINNKELINDDATNMADVIDTFNALEEILSFDSTAGITRITAKLEGLQKGKEIKKDFIDNFTDWSWIGINVRNMNQSTYLKAISNSLNTAKKLSSVLLVNIKKAKVKAKKQSDIFNQAVDRAAKKLKINEKLSVKIGVYSRLKQHTEGLTQEEIDEDFALKLEGLKNEIVELKKQNKTDEEIKRNERKAKVLEEVYSKIKDAKSYSEIESNLSENESKMLDFLEESFAEIRPDLENTYLENQGKDMEGVSYYIPNVVSSKRDGSAQTGDLKNNVSRESLARETSGRTIKRSKPDPTGKTQYNYDIIEVAKFGMKQSLFDINVLYDSQVLANTLSSKDFKEAIDNTKILKELKEKLANTYSPNDFAIDRTEQNKITRFLKDYLKSFVVMPLKTVFQYAKQPISIMGSTAVRVKPKATLSAYGVMSKSFANKEYRKKLDKFFENSTVSIRTVEGDVDIASTDPFYIKFMNFIPGKLAGKATALTKKYISDALSVSDNVAAKGSQLSFYINEKLKKDPDYVFDLDKEVANPDMEAIGMADVEADWVNNNSDVDESPTYLKDSSIIKNMLFLFKSFAVNQSINTILDTRNIFDSKRTGKAEASRALAGTIVGALAFEGMRQALKIGSEKMLSLLLDDMEDEEKKELSEEIGSILSKATANALLDVVAGGAPSDITHYFKVFTNYANWILRYEDENEERKEMGEELIKKRDKDLFFINDSPGGIIGLAESYINSGVKAVDVLTNEYSTEEMDRVATLNLIMMILQEENLRRPTSKAVKKYKKINKAEEKLYEY
tara:strand:- start:3031 stop:10926 length:7896 start_codon:yes stop_codon:yes gene_type:complete